MSLNQRTIEKPLHPGKYHDKNGLILRVTAGGTKSWICRYQLNGDRHDAGLGSFPEVSLADARKATLELRVMVKNGIDPLAAKQKPTATPPTFEEEAYAFVERNRAGWSTKHADQWCNSLRDHAFPVIGSKPIRDVDTDDILKVLDPIWRDKPETARRVRNRMERVIDFSKTRGHRDGENPARWRGHLKNVLSNVMIATVPLESMPYYALPEFMSRIEGDDTRAARCLQFLILTAARTTEAMGAKWDEIDFETQTWTIPAERMKNGDQHQVPLTEQAMAVLKDVNTRGRSNYIFPNRKLTNTMAENALRRLLAKYETGCTVHGFRATFRMWAEEKTDFPSEICEKALSHTIGNETTRAYNRGNSLEKRRPLMDRWAKYATERISPTRHLVARTASRAQPTKSTSIERP